VTGSLLPKAALVDRERLRARGGVGVEEEELWRKEKDEGRGKKREKRERKREYFPESSSSTANWIFLPAMISRRRAMMGESCPFFKATCMRWFPFSSQCTKSAGLIFGKM
jgi:hypothetical protein